jgi:hypothetical protein
MTNGNEAHASGPEADIAQASNDMIAMSVQRNAEAEVVREAQAVITNAEWAALTPQEQEARIAEADAAYEAYSAQRAAEAELYAEREIEDPEAEIG